MNSQARAAGGALLSGVPAEQDEVEVAPMMMSSPRPPGFLGWHVAQTPCLLAVVKVIYAAGDWCDCGMTQMV